MGYTEDPKNYENFGVPRVKRLGKLFRGMPVESIAMMKQDVIEEALDDLDDLDLNDALKKVVVEKAALLAQRYKMAKGAGRMRPLDLAQIHLVALGLLPDDLDDMMKTQDDVLDIAEEVKDIQEDLTSGQIDELIENFSEMSSLGDKDVVIDELEAMQVAHMLAYL